jgi:hypothetical protein
MSRRARKKRSEMNGNSLGVALSSGGLAAAERSEGSPPGEPQRSAAAAKAGADPVPASRPDPEVVAKPKRRTYTAEYKQRILQEAEVAATTRGGLLLLCLAAWDYFRFARHSEIIVIRS